MAISFMKIILVRIIVLLAKVITLQLLMESKCVNIVQLHTALFVQMMFVHNVRMLHPTTYQQIILAQYHAKPQLDILLATVQECICAYNVLSIVCNAVHQAYVQLVTTQVAIT